VVVDTTGEPRVIAEVSFPTALTTLHEKAIYLHEARQYHVERFDYAERKAYVKRVESDYYTDAIDYTQVKVLEEYEGEALAGARRAHGDVRVNRQIVGFKKIKFYTLENVGAGSSRCRSRKCTPRRSGCIFHRSFLARLPHTPRREAERASRAWGMAAHGGRAAVDVRPAGPGVALSEDISGGLETFEPNLYLLRLCIPAAWDRARAVPPGAAAAEADGELLAACGCEAGCPSCVGRPGEVGERGKEVAARMLGSAG